MGDLLTLYRRNHRVQQLMLAGGVLGAAVCGAGFRSERALFVIGDTVAPKAFAAIAPEQIDSPFDSATRQAARRLGLLQPAPQNPVTGRSDEPAFAPPSAPALDSGAAPAAAGPAGPEATPQQLASNDVPVGRTQGGSLTDPGRGSFGPGVPTTTTGTVVTPPTTPEAPVGPVPEPATWVMMLVGFFGLGAILRRARALSSD